jgi:DNA-directed RNA polymerase I, II, and III subunit RPABC1
VMLEGLFRKTDWRALADDLDRRYEDETLVATTVIVVVNGEVKLEPYPNETRLLKVEMFQQSHVLLDVVHHRLQPEFHVLSKQETETMLAHHNATITQLPVMKYDDPIARYFALARGDVMMCIRNSETAGKAISYRVVL